jgi:predicted nucleic acid-binding protein
VIILNSSPVIHLTVALGGLDALPALYGRVLVPEPVLRELEAGAELDDTARRLRTVPGIEVYALATGVSPLLAGELDLGEAAVIQLALDLPGATVVLDDLKARRVARRSSIPITGSLGVRLHAKRRGKLHSLAQAVGRIRRHGRWLADDVVERVLALAGEWP